MCKPPSGVVDYSGLVSQDKPINETDEKVFADGLRYVHIPKRGLLTARGSLCVLCVPVPVRRFPPMTIL